VPAQLETTWTDIREELRREAPDFKFHIWLAPLELVEVAERKLIIRAPEHIRTGVEERYLPLLLRVARRLFDAGASVEIVGDGWRPSAARTAAGAEPPAARGGEPGADRRLNPKYTFDQFVIGSGNRFAHAASLAVAEMPGQAYNPLFVHGPPGLGKTHLLHAIGNYVTQFGSGLRVCSATVEEFTSEFVEAVRERRTTAFKDRFRKADVVLIDDVQFLARKERTREEFFHMFNALRESGRQLVMTSDRSPDELADLEARLSERFQCGLVVPLEPPGFEVRRAILEKRARHDDVRVSSEVLDEIARCVTSSVRALEGALIRVVAYASLRGEEPTPAAARRVLQRLGDAGGARVSSITEILDATAVEFGVDRRQMLARDRRPQVAAARQVAMYLARELTDHSLPEIGRGIGDRNHTTVLHAVNRISLALGQDPDIRQAVDNLRKRLGRQG
jgi:chromosomal replication initiator protein